jgi:hypothetical protein
MLVILKFYLLLMVFGSNSLTVPKDFPSYYPRERPGRNTTEEGSRGCIFRGLDGSDTEELKVIRG